MLDDPRVNFAISTRGREPGLDHLGIQAETDDELRALAARLKEAGHSTFDEEAANLIKFQQLYQANSKVIQTASTLFDTILQQALAVGIGSASAIEIDRLNIRQATLLAMGRSVAALSLAPGLVLVDGNDPPALPFPCEAIIGGDALVCSIAAASIIAKVTRDRMMARLGQHYPAYGFAGHAGYGTAKHRAAIKKHGPCPAHRYSFAPVKGVWTR
ncbi:MAG: ribonuclease HII [Bosea sp.]|nr:ribonuclease HII [Bosea sp. (in: a-proteobacteria)]